MTAGGSVEAHSAAAAAAAGALYAHDTVCMHLHPRKSTHSFILEALMHLRLMKVQ